MRPTRVVLVEDHVLVRAGIRSLLEDIEGVEVVGEAGDGRSAVEEAVSLHPDVVLMDLSLPELHGIEATARIRRQDKRVQVLVLTIHADEQYVAQALEAGAAGYLTKDGTRAELEAALRAVSQGEKFLSPTIAEGVVKGFVAGTGPPRSPLERLTSRQRETLQLVAEGNTTKSIARKLGVSVKTVESHRAQLMDRLDIHDLPALVRFAISSGLVPLKQ